MSASEFYLQVKSTLDKVMMDLVNAWDNEFPGLTGCELDDVTLTSERLGSPTPMLVWQLLNVTEAPRDPLYQIGFMVGAKTVSDAGNYNLAELWAKLNGAFLVETVIQIGDYSGATASLDKGYMVVKQTAGTPQQFDEQAGLRFISVSAVGARKV